MECNVCKAKVLRPCKYCGDNFKAVFCFSDDDGNHHFCSELCFELWIVAKYKHRLRKES